MSQPIDVLASLGIDLKRTSNTNGGEWHGPCPICKEGTDRFFVTPDHPKYRCAVYYCRRCQKGGKVYDLVKYLGGDASALPAKKAPANKERGKNPLLIQKFPPPPEWQKKLKYWTNSSLTGVGMEEPYRRRGIDKKTVEELGLGYNGKERTLKIGGNEVLFREGMVLPNYRGQDLFSVQFRQWLTGTMYYYCYGSTRIPYHYTKLKDPKAPIVIVESALDAVILYQEAGDMIHAVAMGSAQAKPEAYLSSLIEKATKLCVCMDYDDAGIQSARWWKGQYPEAKICFTPTGKDIGDYHLAGGSVRKWVTNLITTDTTPERPEPDIKLCKIVNADEAANLLQLIQQSGSAPGISISENYLGIAVDGQAFSIDLGKVPADSLQIIENIPIIAHDGVACIENMVAIGLQCRNIESTLLQCLTINGMLWDLDKLSEFRLGYGTAFYAGETAQTALSAYICWTLYQMQGEILREKSLEKAYRLYADSQPAVAEIRMTGVRFDTAAHKDLNTFWQTTFEKLDPEVRGYEKLKSRIATYGEKFAEKFCDSHTGRIYTDFYYKETPTGRFTTTAPNLMGVPKDEMRKLFHAPEGKVLLGADYSQIDLRTAAMITRDKEMIKAFKNGTDIHALTAAAINGVEVDNVTEGQRSHAKMINYSSIYGSESSEAIAARKRLTAVFPQFCQWLVNQIKSYLTVGHIKTPAGRVILRNWPFRDWRTRLCNYPIQGGSSEVLLAAMAKLPATLEGLDAKIILCVHDEILLEVAEQDAEVAGKALVHAMEQGFLEIFPEGPTNGLVNLKQGKTWAHIT